LIASWSFFSNDFFPQKPDFFPKKRFFSPKNWFSTKKLFFFTNKNWFSTKKLFFFTNKNLFFPWFWSEKFDQILLPKIIIFVENFCPHKIKFAKKYLPKVKIRQNIFLSRISSFCDEFPYIIFFKIIFINICFSENYLWWVRRLKIVRFAFIHIYA